MSDNLDFFINYNTNGRSILDKYKHFTTKEFYVNNELISKGVNSFVFKLNYQKEESTCNLVLKVINSTHSRISYVIANILYEFYVGRSINIIKQYIPNFVSTIGINLAVEPYNPETYDNIELDNIQTYETFTFNNLQIENGCTFNINNGLITEFLPNSKTMMNMLLDPEFSNLANLDYNIFTSLFQIYAALYSLKDIYAHQDLHLNNVMIVTLPKPTNIKYNIDGREYILITQYIPVIIDYAMNHINLDAENNSRSYIKKACKTTCNKNHSNQKGCYLQYNGMNNNNNPRSYNPEKKGGNVYAKSLLNLNRSIDLYFVARLMYETEDVRPLQLIPDDIAIKTRFRELFNPTTYPEWFRTKNKKRVITRIKQFDPPATGDPYPDSIRYTSDVLIKFLIPYYTTNYVKQTNPILNTININCNFGITKWSNTPSAARSGAELLSILKKSQKEDPISVEELEASLSQAPAARVSQFKPLTIAPARFDDNIGQFCYILRTIEIRPRNPSSEGGHLDAEILSSMELLHEIKNKSEVKKRDVQGLHRLFSNLTDKAVIIREGREITKEQIYKIMNDLFNYSAVSVPGRRGGYYEKYIKYKAKYLRLKALGTVINQI